jgi:C-terminal processing protease CtpA/Prc
LIPGCYYSSTFAASLHASKALWEEKSRFDPLFKLVAQPESDIPAAFECYTVDAGPNLHYRFGYVKLKAFGGNLKGADASTDALVAEFRRISATMQEMTPDGLVIDIRGNHGGDIEAAERMLRMLSRNPIRPVGFRLPGTPAMREVFELLQEKAPVTPENEALVEKSRAEFEAWLELPDIFQENGLSAIASISDPDWVNDERQVYCGKLVLVVDGSVYSAAEMFAAGFQDANLGQIIGVDRTTGGAGANMMDHESLRETLPRVPSLQLEPLPKGTGIDVAIRRCERTRNRRSIEDHGVECDVHYRPNAAYTLETLDAAQIEGILRQHEQVLDEAFSILVDENTTRRQKHRAGDADAV